MQLRDERSPGWLCWRPIDLEWSDHGRSRVLDDDDRKRSFMEETAASSLNTLGLGCRAGRNLGGVMLKIGLARSNKQLEPAAGHGVREFK